MKRLSGILAGAAGICFLVVGVLSVSEGNLAQGGVFIALGVLMAAGGLLPLLRR